MPDYTKQLDEIVKALNRPGTSVWMIAVFSASLGLIGGIFGQYLLMHLTERFRRERMRRALYLDLYAMFLFVDNIMQRTDIEAAAYPRQWQLEEISRHLNFQGEKYVHDNPEIYVRLREHGVADMLYRQFHLILEDRTSFSENTNLALRSFANSVHEGSLDARGFKRFLGREVAQHFLHRVDCRQREDEDIRRRFESSGREPPEPEPRN